ncbi:MAG: 30S ribosomal protein S17 [Patescibacteria group bacterium]|nr:30S ribosomal protein S17 [Patescibacteria group bacterium]MBU2509472.1 30S ribosomal protein S17 [Patescibacteria group bacterium]
MTTNLTENQKIESKTKNRRKLEGVVVSTKMMKTVVVRVDRSVAHPKYGKYSITSKKYKVHDEAGKAKLGDMVEIEETRPLSKEKCWRYIRTIKSI